MLFIIFIDDSSHKTAIWLITILTRWKLIWNTLLHAYGNLEIKLLTFHFQMCVCCGHDILFAEYSCGMHTIGKCLK